DGDGQRREHASARSQPFRFQVALGSRRRRRGRAGSGRLGSRGREGRACAGFDSALIFAACRREYGINGNNGKDRKESTMFPFVPFIPSVPHSPRSCPVKTFHHKSSNLPKEEKCPPDSRKPPSVCSVYHY